MARMLRGTSLVGLLAAGLLLGGAGVAGAQGDKCTIATKGDSPVAKACAEGGATFVTMEDAAREYDRRAPFKA